MAPRRRTARRLRSAERAAWPIAGAALYAAAELLVGIAGGGFLSPGYGRAEAMLFLAFRPALLVIAAGLVAPWPWRRRILFYALALGAAGLSQAVLVMALGASGPGPWTEMARGIAAGALLLALADPLIALVRARFGRRAARIAAGLLLAALMVVPGALVPYERVAIGRTEARTAETRPPLVLATSLPLVWGESGPFDPASRPAPFYEALQREFAPLPIDWVDPEALSRANLALLAQPRPLAPEELVALDAWVRGGGRALILADPQLVWPSSWPIADARRPVTTAAVDPLLRHWGLALHEAADAGEDARQIDGRRIVVAAAGRFGPLPGGACTIAADGLIARCRIGAGLAELIADADLLHARLWAGAGRRGTERHLRRADTPSFIADRLDALAGLDRPRADPPVAWADPDADRRLALLWAAMPLLALLALAALAAQRARAHLQTYPQAPQPEQEPNEKRNGP
jgi:hypothetical protein